MRVERDDLRADHLQKRLAVWLDVFDADSTSEWQLSTLTQPVAKVGVIGGFGSQ
jgi:hypothetical protein